MQAYAMIQNYD